MLRKKKLGQFYTTNYKYILQNLNIPRTVKYIIEPFAGQGDLLKFVKNTKVECYDIDPKKDSIKRRDTLLDPPNYKNKFILTNPPYLARNKTPYKAIFNKYGENDLYKCFMRNLITNESDGGILIIPLNFWCSIRKNDIKLRRDFLNKYNVLNLNIFEEQIFDDTNYAICSFLYEIKKESRLLNIHIYPKSIIFQISLNEENNYMVGGEIYNFPINKKYKIGRLTNKNKKNTNIRAKCIDDNSHNLIRLSIVCDNDIYKKTSRSYCNLVIVPTISPLIQSDLVIRFNKFMEYYRKKYYSLFLSNYRDGNGRKRISFGLVYKIIGYLLL